MRWIPIFLWVTVFVPCSFAVGEPPDLGLLTREARQVLASGSVLEEQTLTADIRAALERTNSPLQKLETLEILGDLYAGAGHKDYALRSLDEAVRVSEELDDPHVAIQALVRLAGKLSSAGSRVAARNAIKRGIVLAGTQSSQREMAALYADLGLLEAELDEPDAARGAYESAIARFGHEDSDLLLHTRINHLKVMSRQPDADTIYLARALLENLSSQTPRRHATYLLDICAALLRASATDNQEPLQRQELLRLAEQCLVTGLKLTRELRLRSQESIVLGYLGHRFELGGDIEQAMLLTRGALLIAHDTNESGILFKWQWQMGRLHIENKDEARALDSLRSAVKTMLEVRSELIRGSYVYFRENVTPLFNQTLKLLMHQAAAAKTPGTEQQILKEALQMIEDFNASEVLEYFDDDCMLPAHNMARSPIPARTAIVYPLILENETTVIVRTSESIYAHRITIAREEIDDLILEYRLSLEAIDDDYLDLSSQLFDWLIRPLTERFTQQQISTLVFVPTGSLRTIPFSTLFDGESHLVEKYAIATSLGLQLTVDQSSSISEGGVLLGGISDAVQGFSGLPGVEAELSGIASSFGGEILMNSAFSLDDLSREMAAGNHSIIHLATHGYFDRDPLRSFLLTYDDRLSLNRLQDTVGKRRFANNPLELLVLSACETATGDERAALGLAGVSLKAGAHTTLATLWPISDAATSKLMIAFYSNLQEGMSKSDALRESQRFVMNDIRFEHPFFWSPFLLIGNWL